MHKILLIQYKSENEKVCLYRCGFDWIEWLKYEYLHLSSLKYSYILVFM